MIRSVLIVAAVMASLPVVASAGDARRDAILADYAVLARRADPAFTSFSAQRGQILFRAKWTDGDPRTPSCTSCHTDTPQTPGRNAKTGRPIAPLAVSAAPERFTDRAALDKHFSRDCRSVIGRDCTPAEQGDYVTFMVGQ